MIGGVIGLALAIPYSSQVMDGMQCVLGSDKPVTCDPEYNPVTLDPNQVGNKDSKKPANKPADKPVSKPASSNSKSSAIPPSLTSNNPYPRNTLKWYMVRTGFRGQQLNDMGAILIGESGIGNGKINAMAHNCNSGTGDDSYGLGQINLLGPLKSRLNTYKLANSEALYDPTRNLQITYELAQTPKGYKHWGAFNQKTHLRFYGMNPVVVKVPNRNCVNV